MITRPHTQGKYTGWQGSTTSASSGTHGSTANKAGLIGFYRGRQLLAHNLQGHPITLQTVAQNNRAPTETYTKQPTLGNTVNTPKSLPLFTTDELIIIGIVVIFVISIIAVVLIHG